MNISLMYSMFLGDSPRWYKQAILSFLIINPILLIVLNSLGLNGGFIMGWIILLQFIFTLALALKCYPLQPGGLLAIEALAMDLSNPYSMMHEIEANIETGKGYVSAEVAEDENKVIGEIKLDAMFSPVIRLSLIHI